jgi:hypothetical protein
MLIRNSVFRIIILLLLTGSMTSVSVYGNANSGKEHLMKVRALLANIASVSYARHEVVEKAGSGYEFLPEIVKKITYFIEKESELPSRVDYFKRRLLFADKFLVRQYFFFTKGSQILYEVWTEKDNSLIKFVYISPAVMTRRSDNTADRKIEYFYYDKSGKLMKRWVSTVHIDHNKEKATFTDKVFDGQGNLINENSGAAVYEEFI